METFHGRLDRDFMKLSHLQRHISNIETVLHITLILKSRSNSSIEAATEGRQDVFTTCTHSGYLDDLTMI